MTTQRQKIRAMESSGRIVVGGGAAAASAVHLLCVIGLIAGYAFATRIYSWSLVTHPVETLRLLFAVETPLVIAGFSSIRRHGHRSIWKAMWRGMLALPVGALLNAFGAVVLGASVGSQHLMKTIYWSLLMSLFTFVPACCAFGLERTRWQSILSPTKLDEDIDFMISLPAFGTVIGSWFGAWPMPLDWERPLQEWPICVTYGGVAGYLAGVFTSQVTMFALRGRVRAKRD